MNKLQANLKQGVYYDLEIKDLGEFKFLFSINEDKGKLEDKNNQNDKSSNKEYFLEAFWNPPQYGLVDFLVGYYVDDIDKEMDKIIDDMSYFIDGARVSCLCRIKNNHDDEGVYEGILDMWFDGWRDEDNSNEDKEDYFCLYDGDISELYCSDKECENCAWFGCVGNSFTIVDCLNGYYGYYGYPEFVNKVIYNFIDRDKYGLTGEIKLIGAEPSKRVFFENENGDEFTVRYFISEQDEIGWKASYTLYKDVRNEDGSGHGEEIDEGFAGSRYVWEEFSDDGENEEK